MAYTLIVGDLELRLIREALRAFYDIRPNPETMVLGVAIHSKLYPDGVTNDLRTTQGELR